MDYDCFTCTNSAEFHCLCTSQPILLCKDHIPTHIASVETLQHHIEPLYRTISPEQAQQRLQKINIAIKNFESLQRNLEETLKDLLSFGREVSSQLSFSVIKLEKMKKELISHRRVHWSQLFHDKIFEIAEEELECIRKSGIPSKGSKLHKKILASLIENDDKVYEQSKLYIAMKERNELVEYDTVKNKITKYLIDLLKPQGCLASICLIPGNKLFSSGGKIDGPLSLTFSIDFSMKTVQILPKTIARDQSAAIYYKNGVYIFGGRQNESALNAAEKYSLIESSWEKLSNLPMATGNSSTLLLNGQVLISGENNFLCLYEIFKDSYNLIPSGCLVPFANILMKNNEKIILLTNKHVYVCNDSTLLNWKVVKQSTTFGNTTSKPAIRGRYAYFADWRERIFQFDWDSYKVKEFSWKNLEHKEILIKSLG